MKPRRELKVGDKIRFSGPCSENSHLFIRRKAEIVSVSADDDSLSVHFQLIGAGIDNVYCTAWIHRCQVVSVFVKKKKESKYPKEVWVNFYTGIDCYLGGRTAFETKDQADRLLGNREIGKAIRYVLAKGQ